MIKRQLWAALLSVGVALSFSANAYADDAAANNASASETSQPGSKPASEKKKELPPALSCLPSPFTKDPTSAQQAICLAEQGPLSAYSQHLLTLIVGSFSYGIDTLFDGDGILTKEHPTRIVASLSQQQISNSDKMRLSQWVLSLGLETRMSQLFYLGSRIELNVAPNFKIPDAASNRPLNDQAHVMYHLQNSDAPGFYSFALNLLFAHPFVHVQGTVGVRTYHIKPPFTQIGLTSTDPKNKKIEGEDPEFYGQAYSARKNLVAAFAQLKLSRRFEGWDQWSKLSVTPSFDAGIYSLAVSNNGQLPSTTHVRLGLGATVNYQVNPKVRVFVMAKVDDNMMSYTFDDGSKKNAFGYRLQLGAHFKINENASVQATFNQYAMGINGIHGFQAGANVQYQF